MENERIEELELSDAQLARNDEIYNGVHTLCQMMAEDDALAASAPVKIIPLPCGLSPLFPCSPVCHPACLLCFL